MNVLILAIVTVLIGSIDELKYLLQYRKIKYTKRFGAVSKRFYLISILTKSWVLCYAIWKGEWVFGILYTIGLISSMAVLYVIYRYSNIKDRNIIKFILRCFHISITKK